MKIEAKKQIDGTVEGVPDYEIGARKCGIKSRSFEVLKLA